MLSRKYSAVWFVCSPDQVHWDEVARVVKQLALALQHLHESRLIHGDFKP
jgi:serine/threonine protein kinase